MNQYEIENIKRTKTDNMRYYKPVKTFENKEFTSTKSEYQTKIQNAKNNLSSMVKESPISNTKRNYDTHDLITYLQNSYLNNNKNTKNNKNNSYDKKKGRTTNSNNKNNYLGKEFPNFGIKTEANNYNKNNKVKQKTNLLIEIINSNRNEDIYNSFEKRQNLYYKNNKIKKQNINNIINNNDSKIYKFENERKSHSFLTDDKKFVCEKKGINNEGKLKGDKRILNKNNKIKMNNDKLIINLSNNSIQDNPNNNYSNNKTSSNSINNYFKIKNMNLHFLNEVHHSPTEINVLTSQNNDDSFKKLKLNISSDLLFKEKIKNDLDQIKKNKELSQQLENTSKELDQMHNIKQKYLSSINKNINMKKEYKYMKMKNDSYSRDIMIKEKEINEQKYLINKLYSEVRIKNNYIKEIKDTLIKKDEIINILNNKIKNIKGKYDQLINENKILYKFKELYDENSTKSLKLEKNINKYMDINNKYISLQQNYNTLENKYNRLLDIQIKYENLKKENLLLKELEKNYKDICYKYNEVEENNIELKDLKINYDYLYSENKSLINIKNKFDKIYPEYLELKEIRIKYDDILKEQKNLIMIENKYNDLVQEIQELKVIKNKYDELMKEKLKEKTYNINIINKMKSELNETIKQNIILKNDLELKIKENDKLKLSFKSISK